MKYLQRLIELEKLEEEEEKKKNRDKRQTS